MRDDGELCTRRRRPIETGSILAAEEKKGRVALLFPSVLSSNLGLVTLDGFGGEQRVESSSKSSDYGVLHESTKPRGIIAVQRDRARTVRKLVDAGWMIDGD